MFMEMEGSAVFRWATTQLVPVARRACELAGVAPEELDAIVLHQANLRITESIARSLGRAAGRSWPATSSTPATRRPRPCRSRCPG